MNLLTSFPTPIAAVVVGASGGIGKAITHLLLQQETVTHVCAFARKPLDFAHAKLTPGHLDLLDEASIAAAAATLPEQVQLIFVASGMLHNGPEYQPEKSWRSLRADAMLNSYAINAVGPALVAKHFLPRLPRNSRAMFAALSARVGSISDNHLGGWHSYRAAKAALNQLIRTMSLEMAHKYKEAICVGLHPGTVDTGLSKPFQGNVAPDKLFAADEAAACLLAVINQLTPADSGGLFAWDGTRIPY